MFQRPLLPPSVTLLMGTVMTSETSVTSIGLHGGTIQTRAIFVLATVRTSKLKCYLIKMGLRNTIRMYDFNEFVAVQ
jgi:hypothetical protein